MVTESQIAKLYAADNRRLFFYVWRVRNQRLDQAEQVHVEFSELADRNFSAHRQRHAGPNNEHEPESDQKSHQGSHHRVDPHQTQILLRIIPVELVKGGNLGVFLSVGPYYAHAGKVFLSASGNLREKVLDLL